jgi:hypothetical protein
MRIKIVKCVSPVGIGRQDALPAVPQIRRQYDNKSSVPMFDKPLNVDNRTLMIGWARRNRQIFYEIGRPGRLRTMNQKWKTKLRKHSQAAGK